MDRLVARARAASLPAALAPPRALAAWALLGYTALHLFFSFWLWVLPGGGGLTQQSANAGFRSLFVMAMPVLAVLLAVYVAPAVARAGLICAVAVAELAIALFFGVLTWLIGLGFALDWLRNAHEGMAALSYVVMGVADLALIALAAFVALRGYLKTGGRLRVPAWLSGALVGRST